MSQWMSQWDSEKRREGEKEGGCSSSLRISLSLSPFIRKSWYLISLYESFRCDGFSDGGRSELNSAETASLEAQKLFLGIRQTLILQVLVLHLLPLPPHDRQLVAGLNKLCRREETWLLEVLAIRCLHRVEETPQCIHREGHLEFSETQLRFGWLIALLDSPIC